MKAIKSIFFVLASVCMLYTFSSCSQKEVIEYNNSDAIAFTPAIGTSTKATPTTTLSLDNFTVEALNIISPSGATSTTYGTNYFNTNVSKSGSTWETAETYYWPNNALGFFAYAGVPVETAAGAQQGSVTISNSEQKITNFSPAKKIEEQKDVIVAYNQGDASGFSDGANPVPMLFKHILSQVEVQAYCANPNIKIDVKGLKICQVAGKGDFTLPTSKTDADMDLNSNWSTNGATWSTIEKQVYSTKHATQTTLSWDVNNMTSLMDGKGSFMLIPSQLTAWNVTSDKGNTNKGAYISILCKITSRPTPSDDVSTNPDTDFSLGVQLYPEGQSGYAYAAVPIDSKWEPGKKYVYKLAFCAEGGGAGNVDPEPKDPDNTSDPDITPDPGKHEGDPVLGGPIKFVEVDVQPWSPADEIQIPEIKHEAKIEVLSSPSAYTYLGGTQTATIKSIDEISNKDGAYLRTEPLEWKAEFSTNGGSSWSSEKPEWLEMPTAGQGGENEEVEIKVYPQEIELNTFNKPLRDATLKGSEGKPFDLSLGKETANCYIINDPGYYKLPLIIGNGRSAGGSPREYASLSDTFVNYEGRKISEVGYEIKDPDNCTLVWQDVENLVSNVKLSSDQKFLEFYVDPATILTGNAVVAVRDNENKIMWSWHIWATNYKLGEGDVTINNKPNNPSSGKEYTLMPLNLGWAEGQVSSYAARSVKVKFTTKTGTEVLPQEIEIKQKEYTSETGIRNTYYQWGRKDPMLPAISTGTDAEQYSKIDDLKWVIKSGEVDLKTAISNPNIFYTGGSKWCSTSYWDLWNYEATSKNSNYKVSKTIYDPSPVGYHIPEYDTFVGYTNDNISWIPGKVTPYNSSYAGRSIELFFVPASGCRDNFFGERHNVGDYGYYWLSTAGSVNTGCGLYFYKDDVYTQLEAAHASGFGVRCVRDF